MIMFQSNFSPVWPWGSTSSVSERPALVISTAKTTAAPFLPLLTLSILLPGQRVAPLQQGLTSVFPPSSNSSHLQTQHHMPVSGSASPTFSPLGLQSDRCAAGYHWLPVLSVVICYFKTNECGEGLECAAYPFSVVLLEIPNQLNGFYDAESGLQQTEHLVKKENAVEEMPFFGVFHWLCGFQSTVQRGPLWYCCSDIWASQQKRDVVTLCSGVSCSRTSRTHSSLSDIWQNKTSYAEW